MALALVVLLKRTGKTRARVSEKSFRFLAGRTTLRDTFVGEVRSWLEDMEVVMVRLKRGGFTLIAIAALEGAPVASTKEHLGDELRRAIRHGTADEDALWKELDLTLDEDEE